MVLWQIENWGAHDVNLRICVHFQWMDIHLVLSFSMQTISIFFAANNSKRWDNSIAQSTESFWNVQMVRRKG